MMDLKRMGRMRSMMRGNSRHESERDICRLRIRQMTLASSPANKAFRPGRTFAELMARAKQLHLRACIGQGTSIIVFSADRTATDVTGLVAGQDDDAVIFFGIVSGIFPDFIDELPSSLIFPSTTESRSRRDRAWSGRSGQGVAAEQVDRAAVKQAWLLTPLSPACAVERRQSRKKSL